MPKNSFQDVRSKEQEKKVEEYFSARVKFDKKMAPKIKKEKDTERKHSLWFVALLAVGFLVFALSIFFSSATVTVIPKQKDLKLQSDFSISKNGQIGGMSFDSVVLSGEETKSVSFTSTEESLIKSKGKIILYNNFSKTSQKLSINTRLEGSNGKIYKTDTQIVIPGINKGTPGSVSVDITADEAGEEYNSGPIDFKILGFKGTPKYEKFYGRGSGDITGGYKGQIPAISSDEKLKITNELRDSLLSKLFKKAVNQTPEDFILFKDAAFLDMDKDVLFSKQGDNTFIATLKGTLYGFVLNKEELTKSIAKNNIKDYKDESVYIPNISGLIFSLKSKDSLTFLDTQNIVFSLSGDAKIVWRVAKDKLNQELIALKKEDFTKILSTHQEISSADLVMRPTWKNDFPEKKEKINVIVEYPQ